MKPMMNTAIKLSQGLSYKYGTHVVINTRKFYSGDNNPITMYVIKDTYAAGGEWFDEELFKTTSMFQVIMFLRDMLFTFQGNEIPVDERWTPIREKKGVDVAIRRMKERYCGSDRLPDDSR